MIEGMRSSRGFTMIELLIVVAIIAILAVAAVVLLNPSEMIQEGKDHNRLSDTTSLYTAIGLAQSDGLSLGNASTVYVSLPDPTLTGAQTSSCGYWNLVSLPTDTIYQCASPQDYRNTDGTGWIPIDFAQSAGGSPFGELPIDPQNQSSSGQYYAYATQGTSYEVTSKMGSQKYQSESTYSNASALYLYGQGTSLSLVQEDYGCADGGPCVWVIDFGNGRIDKFATDGTFLGTIGSKGSGNGQFTHPVGIALDPNRNVYVVDSNNDRVEKFDLNGNYLGEIGSYGSSNGKFDSPTAIAIDSQGNIYVADGNNARVEKFDNTGKYLSQLGCASGDCVGGSSPGKFSWPDGLAVDSNNNLYVADYYNNRIQKFDSSGNYLSSITTSVNLPTTVSVSPTNGYIYSINDDTNDVLEFDQNGNYITTLSLAAWGVSIDANGQIYLSDQNDGYTGIWRFNSTDTTHINTIGSYGNGNGQMIRPDQVLVR